jgi:hypothetical protein
MANTSRVNGFFPIKYLNGAAYNGAANLYFIPSGDGTAVFLGDLVKAETTGDPAASGGKALGVQSVIQAAAGNAVLGVIVGFAIDPTNLNSPQYRAASTGKYVYVSDDPNVLYEVQTSNGTAVLGDVGNNANFAVAAGSTTTGASGMTLDVGTILTTATLPLKIMGFTQRVDNDNTAAAAKLIVKLNNDQFMGGTGTAGV